MRSVISLTLILFSLILSGCAAPNMQLSNNFWQDSQQKIVVAAVKAPTPQIYQTGNEGLLDYAINSARNSSIDNYLKQTDLTWYYNDLPNNLAKELRKRHINAEAYSGSIIGSQRSYAELAGKTNSDKILVLRLKVGGMRSYNSFVPTSAPQAYCSILGELIDVKTHKILWHYETENVEFIHGQWNQPPNYPNFTQALKVAIEASQNELMENFLNGH